MKRSLVVAMMLMMCAAAPPQKAQRTIVLDAPVIDREPDPKVPGAEAWRASGGVTLTTADATIAAQSMVLNVGKKGSLEQMHASGGVRIQGTRKGEDGSEQRLNATCNEATYFISEHRLLLSGNVLGTVVEAAKDRTWDLTSEKATIWFQEDRMRLERAKVKFTEPEQPPAKQE